MYEFKWVNVGGYYVQINMPCGRMWRLKYRTDGLWQYADHLFIDVEEGKRFVEKLARAATLETFNNIIESGILT